jgi:non-homologous end joining protein Ku
MKLKHWFITLFIFFTCHTVVSANTTLDKLTQDDGITALKAGDELGFEVLSREELESVRGEGWKKIVIQILDNAGRVQVVYDTWKYFLKNPSYSTCVYSGTANSTPLYCY